MPTAQQLASQRAQAQRAAAGYKQTAPVGGARPPVKPPNVPGGGGMTTAPVPPSGWPKGPGGVPQIPGGTVAPPAPIGGPGGNPMPTWMGGGPPSQTIGQEPDYLTQIQNLQKQMSDPNYQDPQNQAFMNQQINRLTQQARMGGGSKEDPGMLQGPSGWPQDPSGNPTVPLPQGPEGNQFGQYGGGGQIDWHAGGGMGQTWLGDLGGGTPGGGYQGPIGGFGGGGGMTQGPSQDVLAGMAGGKPPYQPLPNDGGMTTSPVGGGTAPTPSPMGGGVGQTPTPSIGKPTPAPMAGGIGGARPTPARRPAPNPQIQANMRRQQAASRGGLAGLT